MTQLTREEEALLNEIRAYGRMNKVKRVKVDVLNLRETEYFGSFSRVQSAEFDAKGVSGLQLDE